MLGLERVEYLHCIHELRKEEPVHRIPGNLLLIVRRTRVWRCFSRFSVLISITTILRARGRCGNTLAVAQFLRARALTREVQK